MCSFNIWPQTGDCTIAANPNIDANTDAANAEISTHNNKDNNNGKCKP